MMRLILPLTAVVFLSACGGEPRLVGKAEPDVSSKAETSNLRLGAGYRGSDDPCVRVGSSEAVAGFVSQESDLVGCPLDFEGRPAFIKATLAREVTRTDEWVVYSVPLFGAIPTSELPSTPPITGG